MKKLHLMKKVFGLLLERILPILQVFPTDEGYSLGELEDIIKGLIEETTGQKCRNRSF